MGTCDVATLPQHIRKAIAESRFTGEGYRKIWARLRFAGIRGSPGRVRRLMGTHELLAPHRVRKLCLLLNIVLCAARTLVIFAIYSPVGFAATSILHADASWAIEWREPLDLLLDKRKGVGIEAEAGDLDRESITAYSGFSNLCTAMVVGYEALPGVRGVRHPRLGRRGGACAIASRPAIFSVTHENSANNHAGAANSDPSIRSYMADFDPEIALGRWIDFQVTNWRGVPVVSIKLDTVNFNDTNVTGWPIRYGHLFAAVNDPSPTATLDRDVVIDVDIRVHVADVRPDLAEAYSGRRIMVGALINWEEATPRTNTSHFIEVDLLQSDGYTASYGDPDYPLCRDVAYDRCFYSRTGQYAEGREVRYQTLLHGADLVVDNETWNSIHVDLTETVRRLQWVSPPRDWHDARLTGLYIGIESQGATRTAIDLRNYRLTAAP